MLLNSQAFCCRRLVKFNISDHAIRLLMCSHIGFPASHSRRSQTIIVLNPLIIVTNQILCDISNKLFTMHCQCTNYSQCWSMFYFLIGDTLINELCQLRSAISVLPCWVCDISMLLYFYVFQLFLNRFVSFQITKLNCLQTLNGLFASHPSESNLPATLNGRIITVCNCLFCLLHFVFVCLIFSFVCFYYSEKYVHFHIHTLYPYFAILVDEFVRIRSKSSFFYWYFLEAWYELNIIVLVSTAGWCFVSQYSNAFKMFFIRGLIMILANYSILGNVWFSTKSQWCKYCSCLAQSDAVCLQQLKHVR